MTAQLTLDLFPCEWVVQGDGYTVTAVLEDPPREVMMDWGKEGARHALVMDEDTARVVAGRCGLEAVRRD